MIRLLIVFLLIFATPALARPKLAVVSYWGTRTDNFWRIPDHSVALINPDSGIFKGQTETLADSLDAFRDVRRRAAAHDVALYAYVPTGYFHHDCNTAGTCQTWARVEAQVKAYFTEMPDLTGIFFDETAPADYDCALFAAEYARLRTIVAAAKPTARIIFNVGMPDTCAVDAAQSGEMVVLFENDGAHYVADYAKIRAATDLARSKGVLSWHMVNDVPTEAGLDAAVRASDIYAPDYLYVVDVSGDWRAGYNTYGDLPRYWRAEVKALSGSE